MQGMYPFGMGAQAAPAAGFPGMGKQMGAPMMGSPMGKMMGPQMGKAMGPQMGKAMTPQMGPQMGKMMGPQMGAAQMGAAQMGAPQMGKMMGPQMGQMMPDIEQQMLMARPPMLTTLPAALRPPEQTYVENIMRMNRGKVATIYTTYENNSEWNAMVFKGVVENAARDHVVLSDPETGMRYIILMINIDYITFDEELRYDPIWYGE